MFGLLVAGPLYGGTTSAKIAAVTIGVFGLMYHGLLATLLLGAIAPIDIESSFLGARWIVVDRRGGNDYHFPARDDCPASGNRR